MEHFTTIVLAVIAIAEAPMTAWISSRLLKGKYQEEIKKLHEEVRTMQEDVRSRELTNDKTVIEMTMKYVEEPVKTEMMSMRREIGKLKNAIEKIPYCPHSANCPVTAELRRAEDDDTAPEKSGRRRKASGGADPQA